MSTDGQANAPSWDQATHAWGVSNPLSELTEGEVILELRPWVEVADQSHPKMSLSNIFLLTGYKTHYLLIRELDWLRPYLKKIKMRYVSSKTGVHLEWKLYIEDPTGRKYEDDSCCGSFPLAAWNEDRRLLLEHYMCTPESCEDRLQDILTEFSIRTATYLQQGNSHREARREVIAVFVRRVDRAAFRHPITFSDVRVVEARGSGRSAGRSKK